MSKIVETKIRYTFLLIHKYEISVLYEYKQAENRNPP